MNEIALAFGPDRGLLGILSLPEAAYSKPLAFVLFNAGVIHRIGPHRINVKLARHLAALGFATLRFDLSGQGDSRAASGASEHAQQAVTDLRAAMDHLERTVGVHRFAIAGICSGADNGWAVAQVDARVTALCMIDGYHYPTPRTRWIWYRKRLQGPIVKAILPWLARRLGQLKGRKASSMSGPLGGRIFPDKKSYAQVMQSLTDRQVQMLLVFTGSLLPQYNHPEQFREAFAGHAFVDCVEARYCPDMDHTLTPLGAQQELLELMSVWATSLT